MRIETRKIDVIGSWALDYSWHLSSIPPGQFHIYYLRICRTIDFLLVVEATHGLGPIRNFIRISAALVDEIVPDISGSVTPCLDIRLSQPIILEYKIKYMHSLLSQVCENRRLGISVGCFKILRAMVARPCLRLRSSNDFKCFGCRLLFHSS